MIIKLLVDGGEMKPGPAVSQQLGPLGINLGKVIQEVNEATKQFKGLKVPVELDVDPSTKEFTITVKSPPVAELLKKEAGIKKGSGEAGKVPCGNLAIEQIIKVAKTKYNDLLVNSFVAAVKTVLGTCVSLGMLVEGKDPREVIREINEGKYKEEIESQKTEVPAEKLQKLKADFERIKAKQEKAIKEAEAEEGAEEKKEEKAEAGEEKKPEAQETQESEQGGEGK